MRSAAPVAVVLAALAVARIEAAVLPCHGCNADQYQLMAMGHGVGQHLVFDFPNQRLSAFTVRCEDQQPAGEGSLKPAEGWRMPCALGLVVESLPLDPEAEEAFRMARQLWLETGGTFRKHVVVAAGEVDAGPSALLLTRDATRRSQVADRLYDHWPLGRELSSVIRTFLALFASDPVVEVFEVVFEDGSRMRVECQLSRQRCAYERGSARDPFDQPIFDGVHLNPRNTVWGSVGPDCGRSMPRRMVSRCRVWTAAGGGSVRALRGRSGDRTSRLRGPPLRRLSRRRKLGRCG